MGASVNAGIGSSHPSTFMANLLGKRKSTVASSGGEAMEQMSPPTGCREWPTGFQEALDDTRTQHPRPPMTSTLSESPVSVCFLKIFYLFIFRERGGEGEKEGEKTLSGCLSRAPYQGPNLAHNPGMCPVWELNRRPFGSQAGAQTTELYQPGLKALFLTTGKTGCVQLLLPSLFLYCF